VKSTPNAATSSFSVDSNYQNSPCSSLGTPLDLDSTYMTCGSLTPAQCNSANCEFQCNYYSCLSENSDSGQNETLGFMCLPTNATAAEAADRCAVYHDFTTAVIVNDCTPIWQKYTPNIDHEDFESPLFYVVMILIALVMISVIFYRYKLSKTGEVPFAVPGWCPTFLYPKPAEQHQDLQY